MNSKVLCWQKATSLCSKVLKIIGSLQAVRVLSDSKTRVCPSLSLGEAIISSDALFCSISAENYVASGSYALISQPFTYGRVIIYNLDWLPTELAAE